jgi:hypothetical protein
MASVGRVVWVARSGALHGGGEIYMNVHADGWWDGKWWRIFSGVGFEFSMCMRRYEKGEVPFVCSRCTEIERVQHGRFMAFMKGAKVTILRLLI